MPTYIAMLNWSGVPQPTVAEVRDAIEQRSDHLHRCGLHSIAFLPDEGECAAVMVATCFDKDSVDDLASLVLPDADVRVESMLFDDDPGTPAWLARKELPPTPRDFYRSLLQAIASDG
jgi:hypothetical protein